MFESSIEPQSRAPIAVIGIGCWYPGARNPLELWENVLSRRLEFRSIPDSRLPLSDYCDPSGEAIDLSYVQRAAVLDGFEFDWVGRRIPKSMLDSTDIVHWLSVEVAEMALHDAGYTRDTVDREGTGVIVGNTLTGDITRTSTIRLRWPYVQRALEATCKAHGLSSDATSTLKASMEKIYKSVFTEPTADTLAGGLANTIAGRVCNYFDLHGGGYIVDGACSSSLLAVCTGARALSTGDLNVALVGGVDISIDPFELVGFSRAGALSKGDMNVYDRNAAGFLPGEGCGFVVMKRLEDARRDGDQIYAVMRGWGISSDGKGGIMTPSSKGQATAIRRAYAGAGYSPADLDFVEGHGTGTKVGDQIELQGVALAQTNGEPAPDRRTGMTSLKSIIGHTKAAAGIGAFIKTAMAVNRRVLPPTGSCTDPNPVFNDDCRSLYPLVHGKVTSPQQTIRAGVSAMGFGGINSHVTLESGDAPSTKIESPISDASLLASNQTSEIYVFTADSYEPLAIHVNQLLDMAGRLSGGDLIDLSADLATRASNEAPIRAVVIAGSSSQLAERLQILASLLTTDPPQMGKVTHSPDQDVWLSNKSDMSRVGFVFPGQGAQQLLMARKLVARFEWARKMVAAADRVQSAAGLPTVTETVFADVQRSIDRDQSIALRKALARTEVAQVAIVTASMIYSRYLEMLGIRPVVTGGHSLGELTALHQAGAFDFETLLQLVSLRGRAMASPAEQSGAMAALFCSRDQAENLVATVPGYIVLANINSPDQVVVSGDLDAVTAIIQKSAEQNISAHRLNVSNAFHSRYVSQAAETLRREASVPARPQHLEIDIYSCLNGERLPDDLDLREHLCRQVVESVDFVSMIESIESQCDLLIEVGPNNVLTKLTSAILPRGDGFCLPTDRSPDIECDLNIVLSKAFAHGVDVQWNQLFENRLARPFVPVDHRKFIGNPCESPFIDIGPVQQLGIGDMAQTSNSADSLAVGVNGRSNGSFTKRPETNAQGLSALEPALDSHNEMKTPTTDRAQSNDKMKDSNSQMTASSVTATPDDGIEAIIVDIIHERTGFPKDSLTSDLRLLDDLNLDSIKAGDVIATAARKVGAMGPIDPASLADASIADVVHAVRQATQETPATTGGDAAPAAMPQPAMPQPAMPQPAMPQPAMPQPAMPQPAMAAQVMASTAPQQTMAAASPQSAMESVTPPASVATMPLASQTPASPAPMATASVAATPMQDDHFQQTIVEIIAERTGFPEDSLTMELRLLDDLNLDSIKAGDIIATAARRLSVLGPIDPASLADASIGDVVAVVREAAGGESPSAATTAPPTTAPPTTAPATATTMTSKQPSSTRTGSMESKSMEPSSMSASDLGPSTSAPPADAATMDDGIESMIIDIIHDRTGFPKETLSSDLRLLDDLNLDSIKAGDIIATVARQVGAMGPIDPASLADATIGDVANVVRGAMSGDNSSMPAATMTATPPAMAATQAPMNSNGHVNGNKNGSAATGGSRTMAAPVAAQAAASPGMPTAPAQMTPKPESNMPGMSNQRDVPDWVHNFAIELAPHRPRSAQQDITGRHYRVLYDPSSEDFAQLLGRRFRERNATASFETFDQPGQITGDSHVEGAPFYVIAVLPKETDMSAPRERLPRMIHRLRRTVSSTNPMTASPLATGIAFVQFGDGVFGMEGMSNVESCAAASFARAVHLESPTLQVRIIDFAEKLSDFLATDFITNEMAAEEVFRDAAYDRLGRRYETRHRLMQSDESTRMPIPLNGQDVVLVTGGARGITAECALALAQKTGANFALVGSSPHPMSSNMADNEIANTLRRFESLPGKCEYFSCDLTDENAVRQLVGNVESQLGRITGLVHGAGRNHPKMASASTAEEILAEVSPKVLGAANLLDALGDRSLRCLVGLTSIIGVTGIPGNSWYAFSNETLDLLLRKYKTMHPESLVRSVSYSAWKQVGMGAKGNVEANLRRMGVGMIPPQQGIDSFMYALEHDLNDVQMICTGSLGPIDTWRPTKCTNATRYIDRFTRFEPGTALTTRVTLCHKRDPYLLDHIYEGTCLFPAVFGLEAMAQAASHLSQESHPTVLRIQNVELTRPIIVGNEGSVELEIVADTVGTNAAGETVIAASIRTERTQFHYDHFACEVVFGTPQMGARQPDVTGAKLGIDPQKDLYNGILFQGPRFQRWGDTHHLEEGKIIFDVGHCSTTCSGEHVFCESVEGGPLLTGDPFFRDVLLQSIQAVIPQKTGLPLSIERIEFFAPSSPAMDSDHRTVTSMLHVIADEVGQDHVCEVIAKDATGQIRERMVNYRVKVLAIKEEYPTAMQLANLESFDQSIFDKQIMQAFNGSGALAPAAVLKRMPMLHGMNRDERHVAERPMMEETIAKHQEITGKIGRQPLFNWLDSGRPVVTNDNTCMISLSHDDDYCLCIANPTVAGCDIAPITPRSRDEWAALIGMHNEGLLDQLMEKGDCLDKAGTRIWAAVEAVQKSTDQAVPVSLQLNQANNGAISFASEQLADGSVLLTTPVSLHRKPVRIVAMVAPAAMSSTASAPMQAAPMQSAPMQAAPTRATSMKPAPMQAPMQAAVKQTVPAKMSSGGSMLAPSQPMDSSVGKYATPSGWTHTPDSSSDASPSMAAHASPTIAPPPMSPRPVAAPQQPMKSQSMPMPMAEPMQPAKPMAEPSDTSMPEPATADEPSMRSDVAPPGEERSIDNVSAMVRWDGPRDQAVFEHRFVVTFKECAMRGKHVQHTQFLSWMGSMRENGLLYLVPDMVLKLSDGLSGMATNWTGINVVGEAMMGDVIVARLWMESKTDSSISLCCDFVKAAPNGRDERLATVRQATTWVALDGKNDPIKEPFPKFLADAFDLMAPRSDREPKLPELPESLGRMNLEMRKLEAIPKHAPVVLWTEKFSTCMDDSNIVANIYYSRYFHWQWRTTDLFLYSKVPQLVSSITELGNVRELLPMSSHIDYVRDAFPFDRLETELAVVRSNDCAATFLFTHYRVNDNGQREKLSAGTQDVVWIRRTPAGTPVPEPFPLAVREALKNNSEM